MQAAKCIKICPSHSPSSSHMSHMHSFQSLPTSHTVLHHHATCCLLYPRALHHLHCCCCFCRCMHHKPHHDNTPCNTHHVPHGPSVPACLTVHAGRWGVRPEKDCSVPSLSPLVFMGLQYRSKVECNLTRECNSSVAGWHPACCGPTVRVPTLPFMPLPVPSRQHVVYVSPMVKALSAHLRFVVESYKF